MGLKDHEGVLLAGLLTLLSHAPQDHLSRVTTTHSGLGPLKSIIKRMPYRLPMGKLDRGVLSIDFSQRKLMSGDKTQPPGQECLLGLNVI